MGAQRLRAVQWRRRALIVSTRGVRAEHPRLVRDEANLGARYPIVTRTPFGAMAFRRSRWSWLNEGRDEPKILSRDAAGWLRSGRTRIALLTLEEWKLEPAVYWDELWEYADGLSQQAGDLVHAMKEAWGGSFASAGDWGTIVMLTGAWVHPAHRTRIDHGAILDAALASVTPDHAMAVLVAYPAGFDEREGGAEGTDVRQLGDFDWRQRALMRMYQRQLGFSSMRVTEARPECMWRPRADLAEVMRRALEPFA